MRIKAKRMVSLCLAVAIIATSVGYGPPAVGAVDLLPTALMTEEYAATPSEAARPDESATPSEAVLPEERSTPSEAERKFVRVEPEEDEIPVYYQKASYASGSFWKFKDRYGNEQFRSFGFASGEVEFPLWYKVDNQGKVEDGLSVNLEEEYYNLAPYIYESVEPSEENFEEISSEEERVKIEFLNYNGSKYYIWKLGEAYYFYGKPQNANGFNISWHPADSNGNVRLIKMDLYNSITPFAVSGLNVSFYSYNKEYKKQITEAVYSNLVYIYRKLQKGIYVLDTDYYHSAKYNEEIEFPEVLSDDKTYFLGWTIDGSWDQGGGYGVIGSGLYWAAGYGYRNADNTKRGQIDIESSEITPGVPLFNIGKYKIRDLIGLSLFKQSSTNDGFGSLSFTGLYLPKDKASLILVNDIKDYYSTFYNENSPDWDRNGDFTNVFHPDTPFIESISVEPFGRTVNIFNGFEGRTDLKDTFPEIRQYNTFDSDPNGNQFRQDISYCNLGAAATYNKHTTKYKLLGYYSEQDGFGTELKGKYTFNKIDDRYYAYWVPRGTSFDVEYKDDLENVISTESVQVGGKCIQVPVGPTKPGYKFIGWEADPNENSSAGRIIRDTTLTAKYEKTEAEKYKLTLDGNGGTLDEKDTREQQIAHGDSFDQFLTNGSSEVSRKYYTFDGWYTAKTGGSRYSGSGNTMPASDITVYAHWTRSSSEVTYWDYNERILNSQEVVIGGNATPPADPTRPGYTFIGWDKPSTNIQDHTIIMAQYSKNSYQLTLDGNGGTVGGSAVKKGAVAYGSSFDQILADSASEANRKYYTFDGWYTALIGGSKYSGSGNTMPASDITVYAHWTRSSSEVTYWDYNERILNSQEVVIGGNATPPADPTRPGYTFIGWDKPSTNIQDHTIIMAQYSKNSYQLTLDGNGGTVGGSAVKKEAVVYGSSFDEILSDGASEAGRKYYTFEGWYTAPTGGSKYSGSGNIMPASDITVYAHWTRSSSEVTYWDWDGRVIDSQEVMIGGNATPPADPVRPGYTFTGWDKPSTNIQAPITITAQYVKNSYQLALDGNGGIVDGNAVKKQAVAYGSSFDQILAESASEAGRKYYTFEGWYTAPTGGSKYSGSGNIMPASDITVYAHWVRSTSLVTYKDWNGTTLKIEEVAIGADATPPTDQPV